MRRRYNVQVELADLFQFSLALFTIGTTQESADRLVYGVKELARADRPIDVFSPSGVLERRMETGTYNLPKIPPIRMNPREAFLAPTEFVDFRESGGRVCAEVITPYPPGIPVVSPGEEITQEVIEYLRLELRAGVRMQGPYDSELRTIRVVKDAAVERCLRKVLKIWSEFIRSWRSKENADPGITYYDQKIEDVHWPLTPSPFLLTGNLPNSLMSCRCRSGMRSLSSHSTIA